MLIGPSSGLRAPELPLGSGDAAPEGAPKDKRDFEWLSSHRCISGGKKLHGTFHPVASVNGFWDIFLLETHSDLTIKKISSTDIFGMHQFTLSRAVLSIAEVGTSLNILQGRDSEPAQRSHHPSRI